MSYASSTGDRGPAQRFHADVQKEVRGILGRAPGTGGRLGRAAPSADPDPAVLTCRAMVALYSAAYLRDRQCARDWSVFLERMNRQTRKTGRTPASLVGVLWRPEGLVLPRIVADTGQVLDDVGEGYSGRGALRLMQEPGGREGYRTIVRLTAQRVADAASAAALPEMSPADGRTVTACFGPDRPRRTAAPHVLLPSPAGWSGPGGPRFRSGPPPGAAAPRGGPGPAPAAPADAGSGDPLTAAGTGAGASGAAAERTHVVVVLVAGGRARMEELRCSLVAYGDTAQEWRPFRPQDEEPAVSVVSRALRACGIDRTTVIPLPPGPAAPPPPPERGGAADTRPAGSSLADAALADTGPAGTAPADDRAARTLPAGTGAAGPGGPEAAAPGSPAATPSVVVLVDPWLTGDAAFPELWAQLRERASSVAAVIVVLSRGDEETRANAARLRRALACTPGLELDAPHHEAGSAESLAHTVAGALADAGVSARGGPQAAPAAPPAEGPVERFTRRQRERAAWVTRQHGSWTSPTSTPAPGTAMPGSLLSGLAPSNLWSGR